MATPDGVEKATSRSIRSRANRPLAISFGRVSRCLPADDWLVLALVAATTTLIFVFGSVSYEVLENHWPGTTRAWLQLWERWDAMHYHTLARYGYKPPGKIREFSTNFYPLYPWTVRIVAALTRDFIVAAFVVSGCACAAAAVTLRRLLVDDFGSAISQRAVWFFLIFPTSYFLHIGYAESLFLALGFASLLAARRERWWLAGLLGACCCMARPTGVAVIPALGTEILYRWWLTRRWDWRWLWVLVAPCGFGVFLLLNYSVFGDPFRFMGIRKQFFYNSIAPPWHGLADAWRNRHRGGRDGQMIGTQELFFMVLGLIACVWSWWKVRPSYAAWASVNWLLFSSVAFVASVPRYTLPVFPVFVLFAVLAEQRLWRGVITLWSILFLALFTALYVRGWWAF